MGKISSETESEAILTEDYKNVSCSSWWVASHPIHPLDHVVPDIIINTFLYNKLVSCGQTLFSHRGIIAFSTSSAYNENDNTAVQK